ncbi:uncharacterized protein LOC110184002 [Drosophila serrata]|uniref:uncharacterized protein LOC110184002 n=1 Tax=Drosophila serrata TaxID=7274 RepID=UPI000A1D1B3F|nr:uncharacterized protein LOC110184002 [Drosophila serrata]
MPLPPNLPVPHIVGDDEVDENAPPSPGQRLETDYCLSDSSHDYDRNAFEEETSSSSDGADWSMNVTSIAATPGHIPIVAATPMIKHVVAGQRRPPIPIFSETENDAPPMGEMEVDLEQPSIFSFLNLHRTCLVTNGVTWLLAILRKRRSLAPHPVTTLRRNHVRRGTREKLGLCAGFAPLREPWQDARLRVRAHVQEEN